MLDDVTRWAEQRKFTILLAALLAMALVPLLALEADGSGGLVHPDDGLIGLLLGAVLVAAVHAVARSPRTVMVFSIAALVVFSSRLPAVFGLSLGYRDEVDQGSFVVAALFLLAIIYLIYRAVLRAPHISQDTVLGAVCVYMLIGYAWANLYALVWAADPGAFKFPDYVAMGSGTLIPEYTFGYYSFVTLTTLGYGDITPITFPARTLSWLEAVVGVAFMATVIAFLVSQVVADRESGREF